jgi:hypothetical protein
MAQQFANQAQAILTSAYTAGDTSLYVANGAVFPPTGNFTLAMGYPVQFYLVCTARSGNTLTVTTLGQEGTSTANLAIGSVVAQVVTAGVLSALASPAGAGVNGQVLVADNTQPNGVRWSNRFLTTSYLNPGAFGDRTVAIGITVSGVSIASDPRCFVSAIGQNIGYFNSTTNTPGSYIQFDFGAPVIIDEAIYNAQNGTAQGTWKWQASNTAGSGMVDLGIGFAITTTPQTITTLHGNTTAYQYYYFTLISGSQSNSSWIYGFQFRMSLLSP